MNQTREVNVHYLYYSSTMQARMVKLLGTKMAACMAIEGKISDDGLVSVSSDSMIIELAKELVNGIRADNGAEAVWRKINEKNKSAPAVASVKTEEIVEKEKKKETGDQIVYLDFTTVFSGRKKKSEVIAVKASECDRIMSEKGRKSVQLSLFA